MLRKVWSENSWIPPLFAAASVIVTFIGLGWEWALGLTGLILLVTIFALWNSLQRATEVEVNVDGDLARGVPHQESEHALKPSETERAEDQTGDDRIELEPEDDGGSASDQFDFPVYMQIWMSARDGDLAGVRELSESWVSEVDGDIRQSVSRRSFELRMLAVAGQSSALSELQTLADEHPREPMPVLNLAHLFEELGEPRSGASAIRSRLDGISSEDKPDLLIKEAELWRSSGEPHMAIEVVTQALGSLQPTDRDRAKLLAQRGLAMYETNRHHLAFVDLEQSLELNPGDSDLRFKLAWRYSEQGWEAVAATHYRVLGEGSKPNATALNNLGWSYERLGLSGMAAKTYANAMDTGSARAAGNYALLALDAGLLDQVMGYIDRGLELDKSDDQVARAVARLAEQEVREEKALQDLVEVGRDSRRIIAALDDSDGDLPAGRWILTPGGIVEFEGHESFAEGTRDQTNVTVYLADEIGPMTMRWVDGELSGSEGPVRVKDHTLEAVLIDPSTARVRIVIGRRWANAASSEDSAEQGPASQENGQ